MSDIKTKFTLHTNYKNFVPGVSHLDFERLSLGGSTLGCMLPLVIFAVITSFGLGLVIYYESIEPLLFRVFGQEVTGQVTDCQIIKGNHNAQAGLSYGYTYTWNTDTFSGTASVHDVALGNCSQYVNQPIAIQILTAHPDRSILLMSTTEHILMSAIMLPVGSFWIFITLTTCLLYVRYVRARIIYPRLTRNGILLEGEMTRISGSTASKTGTYHVSVKYQFQSPRGAILKGRAHTHRQDLKGKDLPPVGTPVTILYADDHAHMML